MSIINADNLVEISSIITSASIDLGFSTFNISYNKNTVEEFMTEPDLTTWKRRDLEGYINDGFIDSDPLLDHVRSDKKPILWDRQYIDNLQNNEFSLMIRRHGITGGATIPIPTTTERHSAMTLICLGDLPCDTAFTLQLSRAICYSSLSRISHLGLSAINRKSNSDKLKDLTGKQIKILEWISKGKSNFEISIILELPERQVAYHASRILKTLGVSTRIQAATIYSTR